MKIPHLIKDTLQEKVLIKQRVLNASKYQKNIIKYAQKKVNNIYQQAVSEQEDIYQTAYQQGYNDGAKQLLADFLMGIDENEKAFQKQVKKSVELLEKLLIRFFSDDRIKEIVAHHFVLQQEKLSHSQIYLPANMQQILSTLYPDLKTQADTTNDTIALEFNNEIFYFSPKVATKNIFPQIFSVASRCQLLEKRKANYQKLTELLTTHRDEYEPTDQ